MSAALVYAELLQIAEDATKLAGVETNETTRELLTMVAGSAHTLILVAPETLPPVADLAVIITWIESADRVLEAERARLLDLVHADMATRR